MDFLVENVTGSGVTIGVDLYLTNEGDITSEDFRVTDQGERWMQDCSQINMDLCGVVKKETAVIRSADIVVPDEYNYIVEALIRKNDTIVERG